uniref:Uncharacterized protein n=1 Tax=Panagrolaimus sp. PS1159 TaxID=55785 RepID=A0AC35GHG3_9BILA
MSRPQKVKVITVGNSGVGKTSIILRADGQEFSSNVVASLGASYVSAHSKHDGKEIILQIWDTAGQERFRSMIPLYARNARACILVYDITLRQTFHDIPIWLRELEKSACELGVIMVVANKTDLEEFRVVSEEEGLQLAEKLGATYFETSAKSGSGISTTVKKLGELVAEKILKEEPKGLQALAIEEDDDSNPAKGRRCCGFF